MQRRHPYESPAGKVALFGLLCALALALGFVESMVPINAAVPGIKLGISNVVLLLALELLGKREAFALMLVKVLLSGALYMGFSAMIYSLAGGACSLICMCLLKGCRCLGPVGVSVGGAAAHNFGQIALAAAVLDSWRMFYYLPVLLAAGTLFGFATGLTAALALRALKSGALKDKN